MNQQQCLESFPWNILVEQVPADFIQQISCDKKTEEADAERGLGHLQELTVRPISLEIRNEAVEGKTIKEIKPLVNRDFVISRIRHCDGDKQTELVNSTTVFHMHDEILVIANPIDVEAITVFFGKQVNVEWDFQNKQLISRKILITKPALNGKTLAQLTIRNNFGASITRVNRSGVDLVATPNLQLQMGDRVKIVGSELAVAHAEKILGNSMKRLNHPNLIPIFLGIALGCILGSTPFLFPGIPQPVKLGLAGGPLIVSILPWPASSSSLLPSRSACPASSRRSVRGVSLPNPAARA